MAGRPDKHPLRVIVDLPPGSCGAQADARKGSLRFPPFTLYYNTYNI